MKKVSQRNKWKNVVKYINAVHDCMDDKNTSEQIQLEREMYAWLERNYQIGWNQKTIRQMRSAKLINASSPSRNEAQE